MAVNQSNLLDIILRQKGNDSGYRFCGLADQAEVEGITESTGKANTIYIAQKKMGSKGYPYKIFDNEGTGSALFYVKDEQYKKIQGKVADSLAQILNDKEEREKHSFQHRATEEEFKDVKEEQPVVYIADKYTENRLGHASQIFYTDGSKSILFYVFPGTYSKIQLYIESKAAKKDDSDEIRAFKETLEELKSKPLNNENSVQVNERIEEIVKFIEKISENSSNISSVNKDALAAVKKEAQKFKFELYDYILVNDLRERIANFSIELSKAKGQAEIVELKEAMLTNVDKVQDVSAKEELRKEVITIATKRIQHEILAQTLKIEADGTQRYNFKVVALDIVNSDKKENSHTVSVAERIDTESGAFICYRCKIEKEVDGEFIIACRFSIDLESEEHKKIHSIVEEKKAEEIQEKYGFDKVKDDFLKAEDLASVNKCISELIQYLENMEEIEEILQEGIKAKLVANAQALMTSMQLTQQEIIKYEEGFSALEVGNEGVISRYETNFLELTENRIHDTLAKIRVFGIITGRTAEMVYAKQTEHRLEVVRTKLKEIQEKANVIQQNEVSDDGVVEATVQFVNSFIEDIVGIESAIKEESLSDIDHFLIDIDLEIQKEQDESVKEKLIRIRNEAKGWNNTLPLQKQFSAINAAVDAGLVDADCLIEEIDNYRIGLAEEIAIFKEKSKSPESLIEGENPAVCESTATALEDISKKASKLYEIVIERKIKKDLEKRTLAGYVFRSIADFDDKACSPNEIYIDANGRNCKIVNQQGEVVTQSLPIEATFLEDPHFQRAVLKHLADEKLIVYTALQEWDDILRALCQALNDAIPFLNIDIEDDFHKKLVKIGIFYRGDKYEFTSHEKGLSAIKYRDYVANVQAWIDNALQDRSEKPFSKAHELYKDQFSFNEMLSESLMPDIFVDEEKDKAIQAVNVVLEQIKDFNLSIIATSNFRSLDVSAKIHDDLAKTEQDKQQQIAAVVEIVQSHKDTQDELSVLQTELGRKQRLVENTKASIQKGLEQSTAISSRIRELSQKIKDIPVELQGYATILDSSMDSTKEQKREQEQRIDEKVRLEKESKEIYVDIEDNQSRLSLIEREIIKFQAEQTDIVEKIEEDTEKASLLTKENELSKENIRKFEFACGDAEQRIKAADHKLVLRLSARESLKKKRTDIESAYKRVAEFEVQIKSKERAYKDNQDKISALNLKKEEQEGKRFTLEKERKKIITEKSEVISRKKTEITELEKKDAGNKIQEGFQLEPRVTRALEDIKRFIAKKPAYLESGWEAFRATNYNLLDVLFSEDWKSDRAKAKALVEAERALNKISDKNIAALLKEGREAVKSEEFEVIIHLLRSNFPIETIIDPDDDAENLIKRIEICKRTVELESLEKDKKQAEKIYGRATKGHADEAAQIQLKEIAPLIQENQSLEKEVGDLKKELDSAKIALREQLPAKTSPAATIVSLPAQPISAPTLFDEVKNGFDAFMGTAVAAVDERIETFQLLVGQSVKEDLEAEAKIALKTIDAELAAMGDDSVLLSEKMEAEKQLESLENSKEVLNTKTRNNNDILESISSEKAKLERNASDIDAKLKSKIDRKKNLVERNERLKIQQEDTKMKLEELQKEILAFDLKRITLAEKRANADKRIAELRSELHGSEEALREAEAELKAVSDAVAAVKEKHEENTADILSLQDSITKKQRIIEGLRSQLVTYSRSLETPSVQRRTLGTKRDLSYSMSKISFPQTDPVSRRHRSLSEDSVADMNADMQPSNLTILHEDKTEAVVQSAVPVVESPKVETVPTITVNHTVNSDTNQSISSVSPRERAKAKKTDEDSPEARKKKRRTRVVDIENMPSVKTPERLPEIKPNSAHTQALLDEAGKVKKRGEAEPLLKYSGTFVCRSGSDPKSTVDSISIGLGHHPVGAVESRSTLKGKG